MKDKKLRKTDILIKGDYAVNKGKIILIKKFHIGEKVSELMLINPKLKVYRPSKKSKSKGE